MTRFWMTAAFMVFGFAAGCEKNGVFADAGAETAADAGANTDADIDTNIDANVGTAEDDNGTDEDALWPTHPDISGAWTMVCQSGLAEEVNFNLHFFFFQDGASLEGAESESEDAYCYGVAFSDGQVFLTMEEPCTGSTVAFTGNVASPTLMNGRYLWKWVDAYGSSHYDEGVWYANPSPRDCSPYPNVAGDWTLTYRNGRVEYATVVVEQIENTFRGQSLDGCEYLGVFGFTPECDEVRIYHRCPDLAGQTRVLFGLFNSSGQMSGSWYDMNDTFGCPEIKNGSWESSRP